MTAFADGHAQFIGEQIEYTVYNMLMTPKGTQCGYPSAAGGGVCGGYRRAAGNSTAELSVLRRRPDGLVDPLDGAGNGGEYLGRNFTAVHHLEALPYGH